jgi:hypothetical protein
VGRVRRLRAGVGAEEVKGEEEGEGEVEGQGRRGAEGCKEVERGYCLERRVFPRGASMVWSEVVVSIAYPVG